MRDTKSPSDADMAALQATVDQYRKLCVRTLKKIDRMHTTTRPYDPHPTTALEELLEYIPAFVKDGDLTKAEGERITKKIKMIVQQHKVVQKVVRSLK